MSDIVLPVCVVALWLINWGHCPGLLNFSEQRVVVIWMMLFFFYFFPTALKILLCYLYGDLVRFFHVFSKFEFFKNISLYTSIRRPPIGILHCSMLKTILFPPTRPYLDLFPGIMKNNPSVSLSRLVRLNIIFCSVISLVWNLYRLHPSTLKAQSGSRSQVYVSTGVIIELATSVLANFIFLPISLLHTFLIFLCSLSVFPLPSSWSSWSASVSYLSLRSLAYPFYVDRLQLMNLGVVGIGTLCMIVELWCFNSLALFLSFIYWYLYLS